MQPQNAIITARGLTKSFGDTEVLRGIDLDILKGEVMSIVGPSGAGKTTLLQILGALSRPDSGTVRFAGDDVLAMGDKALSRFRCRRMGFVFQLHRLLPEFTMLENVMLPALIASVPRREAEVRARRLIDYLGLGHRASHRPAELSGGEAQRASVARALVNSPDVILADEPSGSLDLANRASLHRLFFDIRHDMGTTFVIVTHDESLARDCDRMVCMADGRITEIKEK